MSDEYAFRTSWRTPNAIAFFCAHGLLYFGLRSTVDGFIALIAAIAVGLLAWWTWTNRPQWWHQAFPTFIFLGIALGEAVLFTKLDTPPPEPEPFMVTRGAKGEWFFNRGGPEVVDRIYFAIPEKEERLKRPHVLGAFRVIGSESADRSRIEWLVLRKPYRKRTRFLVRSRMDGEKIPEPADYVTLIEILGKTRGRIDAGKEAGVTLGSAYVVFHPAGPRSGGFFIIDRVEEETAEGYLVDAKPVAPQDLTHFGPVKQLILISNARAELAWRAERWDEAEKHYRRVLALSKDQEALARERLAFLMKRKQKRKARSCPPMLPPDLPDRTGWKHRSRRFPSKGLNPSPRTE